MMISQYMMIKKNVPEEVWNRYSTPITFDYLVIRKRKKNPYNFIK